MKGKSLGKHSLHGKTAALVLLKLFILMKGKALRKHSLHGKTAALVVLKLFILMKGKALRKHSLQGKTAASVLLKLFIINMCMCVTGEGPGDAAGDGGEGPTEDGLPVPARHPAGPVAADHTATHTGQYTDL